MANKLNVGFLRGTQSKLDSLTSYVAGSFYLTTDSNRLYFAQSSSELEYLNKYITTVATVQDLYKTTPHEGDFYYVSEGNILCFYNGGTVSASAGWTQVNAQSIDTNDDTKVTGATLSNAVDADSIDVSISIAQQTTDVKGNKTNVAAVTGSTSIKKSDLDAWYNKAEVGVSASAPASNATTISTTGVGASAQKLTVTGGDNVTISGDKDAVVIAAKDTINTSALSSSGTESTAKVTLTESDNSGNSSSKDIAFSGNADVIVNGSTADAIKITHKTGYLTNSNASVSGGNLHQGDSLKVISNIKTSNGHISAIETADYVLPEVTDVIVDANGKINIVVEDAAGTKKTVVGTNAVGYKVGGTLVPLNQDLKDHFYTEAEIDDKFAEHLKSVNAMTYKGSLNGALPTTAAVGDTYIVGTGAAGLNIGGEVAKVGDLIIAYGAEGTDGNISGAITWELIPGTEVDTTYTISAADNKITLTPNNGNAQNITLDDDDVVTLESKGNTITAKHSKPTISNVAASGEGTLLKENSAITLVESEVVNEYGHTTNVVNKKFVLPSNFNTLGFVADTKATQLLNSSGSAIGEFVIDGGTRIVVDAVAGDDNDGGIYTIKHAENAPTVTNNTDASQLAYGGTNGAGEFTVVTGIAASDDKTGHIKSITTQKFKLPAEVTYELTGSATAEHNVATIKSQLKNNGGSEKGTVDAKITSSTLNVTAANNIVTMDLQWEEF